MKKLVKIMIIALVLTSGIIIADGTTDTVSKQIDGPIGTGCAVLYGFC